MPPGEHGINSIKVYQDGSKDSKLTHGCPLTVQPESQGHLTLPREDLIQYFDAQCLRWLAQILTEEAIELSVETGATLNEPGSSATLTQIGKHLLQILLVGPLDAIRAEELATRLQVRGHNSLRNCLVQQEKHL